MSPCHLGNPLTRQGSSDSPDHDRLQFITCVQFFLNPLSWAELSWWINNLHLVIGSPITPPAPKLTVQSDASKVGWGASCQGRKTNGRWLPVRHEPTPHRETFLDLQSFLRDQSHKVALPKLDKLNSTLVAYVINVGDTHSVLLMSLTLVIWTK